MKKKWLVALLAVLALFVLVGCGSSSSSEADDETVTVAMPSAWSDLFPLGEVSYYDNIIFDQVYDPLIRQNSDGSFSGALADSWEVNEDSTVITFYLNEDATWHDGEDFTAADVVASFQMYSDPDVTASSRYFLEYIDGVDSSGAELSEDSIAVVADGDDTVIITLKESTYIDTVLADLCKVYIVAEHVIADLTADEINLAETWAEPMGTGAFIYAGVVEGERMEFTGNANYFLGTPDIENLVIRVVSSDSVLAGLMNGEIDTVLYGGIPLDDWEMAQEQENLVCESAASTNYQLLVINCSKEYLTQEVRQAISMAINREALVESLLQGEGEAIVTPISSLSAYYDDSVEVWYDPDTAIEMLEEAGFPFDQTLTFYVPTGNETRIKAATMIAEDLKAIGLDIEIQQVDFSTLMEVLKSGEADFGILGSGGTMNPAESLEMLTGSFNLCKLDDDNELVQILNQANTSLDEAERLELFSEFQATMKEMTPYAYLYTTNTLVAYNSRLSNVNVANFGTFNWQIYTREGND